MARRPKPDAEKVRLQLAEVARDRLGRFSRIDFLRVCDPIAGCGVDKELADAIEGVDAFLETIETLVRVTDPAEVDELATVVREYRRTLRSDLEAIEAAADPDLEDGDPLVLRRDEPDRPMWVEGAGVGEVMDVTGLTGREASTLALLLNKWSNDGRKRGTALYRWRDGKRYIRGPSNLRVDLNHPAMAPFRDDILAAMRDPDSRREFQADLDAELRVDDDEMAAGMIAAASLRAAREGRPPPRELRPPPARAAELAPEPKRSKRKKKPNKPPAGVRDGLRNGRPRTTRPPIERVDVIEMVAGEKMRASVPAHVVGAYAVARVVTDNREQRTVEALEARGGAFGVYHRLTGLQAMVAYRSRRGAILYAYGFDLISRELGDHGTWGDTKGIPPEWLHAGAKLAQLYNDDVRIPTPEMVEAYAAEAIEHARASTAAQRANVGKRKTRLSSRKTYRGARRDEGTAQT